MVVDVRCLTSGNVALSSFPFTISLNSMTVTAIRTFFIARRTLSEERPAVGKGSRAPAVLAAVGTTMGY